MKTCEYCGTENEDSVAFCTECGAKMEAAAAAPAKERKQLKLPKKAVRIIAAVLAAVIALSACFVGGLFVGKGSSNAEGKGYKTPEAAAEAFLKAMKKQDPRAAAKTFAVESFVKNLDVNDYTQHSRSFEVNSSYVDGNSAYIQRLNEATRAAAAADSVRMAYYSIAAPELCGSAAVEFADGETASAFFDAYFEKNPSVLTSMKRIQFLQPVEIKGANAGYEAARDAYVDTIREYLNCDDIVCLTAGVEINGEEYYFFADTVCFSGKWYILDLGGFGALNAGSNAFCPLREIA